MIRVVACLFLFSVILSHAEPFQEGLVGRWKLEFQDPPEKGIVAAQLNALNLGHLIDRVNFKEEDAIILTIARNKLLVQAGQHLFEAYNCVLEMDEIVILTRQQHLSPLPRAYQYKLDGDELILTGELNKLNDLPVVLKLRRVKAIPVFVNGTRGFMLNNGFLEVGKLISFRGDQVKIQEEKNAPYKVLELGQLAPLDQVSLHDPSKVNPSSIGATLEAEAKRLSGLRDNLASSTKVAPEPMHFTKKYYFNEAIMSEGYMVTIFNTPIGEITFRAAGTGGGGSRGDLEYRYLIERETSKLIVWVDDEVVPEQETDTGVF